MAEVSFADDLYGGSTILSGGCGLKGFVRTACWYYSRHDGHCKPGMWSVSLSSMEAGDFWPLLNHEAQAVVDDFGNLVPVRMQ